MAPLYHRALEGGRGASRARLGGVLIMAGGVVFTLFNTVAEGSYPNYSVATNALSDLGAVGAPTALLWDGQLFAAGVLGLAGMLLFFFKSSTLTIHRRGLTSVLFLAPQAGTILVSLVPENTILALHGVAAFLVFTLGGISAVYAYRFTPPPFRYFSVLLGLVSLGAILLLGAPSLVGFGLAERLVVYPLQVWDIAFAGLLMSL